MSIIPSVISEYELLEYQVQYQRYMVAAYMCKPRHFINK